MNTKFKHIVISSFLLGSFFSCTPDRTDGIGNGLVPKSDVNGAFTVTEKSANRYIATASGTNYLFSKWNFDDEGFLKGNQSEEVFFPDAGVYTIEHQAIAQGGMVGASATQTVTVPKDDPFYKNLVQGPRFNNATDWSKWTVNPAGSGNAKWTFSNGWATLTATGSSGAGIFQAINVIEGQEYTVDFVAKSTTGATDTWFECYIGYNVPVIGQDYNGNGTAYRKISTWDETGKDPFSGRISNYAKGKDGNGGVFKATQTGTVYLGIRGGGADMKGGISITKVELRRSK